MKKEIIFNVPKFDKDDLKNINNLTSLKHYSGNGYFTNKCNEWLVKNLKCKESLLVHSCTAALEISAILLNLKAGDEVIMPSYTFVSTANAFVLRGAKIVFIDVDKKTLNINPKLIEKKITKKTRAIVIVHYAGVSCEMEKIKKITKKNRIILIEDAAQALLSKYKGKPLGSFGDLATISFHETKNIHCGEGGALLINNKKFIRRAKIIKDKGTNRDDFNKKIVKKYTWVDLGSSYSLSEINAAFLYSQLKKAKEITRKRIYIWRTYNKFFSKLEKKYQITRPFVPKYAGINGHSYFIFIKKNLRNDMLNFLNKKNIMAIFHYIPLHSSPYGKKLSKTNFTLENTDLKAASIIRLPMHLYIKEREIKHISNKVIEYFKNQNK